MPENAPPKKKKKSSSSKSIWIVAVSDDGEVTKGRFFPTKNKAVQCQYDTKLNIIACMLPGTDPDKCDRPGIDAYWKLFQESDDGQAANIQVLLFPAKET
jgi:hypothetical protein